MKCVEYLDPLSIYASLTPICKQKSEEFTSILEDEVCLGAEQLEATEEKMVEDDSMMTKYLVIYQRELTNISHCACLV